ncbi:ornithine carbamoyltransferase [methanotrophic endosymbiont of Bathymodiolus puteoserpentis (Logatchev)]|uniref:ornithine carbamoyltransferase n=1 Tax=methanotrophic endosymbiont of Bathymodiolus puteoserpentis (Logatchev) TaxID=343235 RepID=UPI0013C652F1|nr:ornithine carbamoyltransferase [methanotrophic endosymbiont of Bathymodiolus puteoserpentis (Logatchev)]SHE23562.1 Ornithine carbamoyltransferase [methanotrophic endosymbiont of Bathymodiolus puteoserpentis (Logatchev)]
MNPRHFISLLDLSSDEFRALINRAIELKNKRDPNFQPLKGQVLAMIFEKSSTRTRISFETGMTHFGGSAIFLSPRDTQLGRGEPIKDSAKVISSMVDGIMLRTNNHETVTDFAKHSSVPVINGLTDILHPCQLLADMQTYFEHRGDIQGKTVTWIGDGNNMCHSYINAAVRLDFKLNIASPEAYLPNNEMVKSGGERIQLFNQALDAAKDSDLIVTDVWASMGQEEEQKQREIAFKNYQVNQSIIDTAHDDALFMHCLPAHRGEEVTAEVIDGKQSVIYNEAENRLHAQKALLELLMCT